MEILKGIDWLFEPINDPMGEPIEGISETLNEPLCEPLFETIKSRPGISRAELIMRIGKSRATVARSIAALVKAGRVEHRGSKKTGGRVEWERRIWYNAKC